MKTGVLYLIFNSIHHVLAVLSGTEPIVEFSSILDLDEFLKGSVKKLTANSQKMKDILSSKYYYREIQLNDIQAVIQVLELDESANSGTNKRKDEQRWLAYYNLTGSYPLTVSQISTDKKCNTSEARSILNRLLKKD